MACTSARWPPCPVPVRYPAAAALTGGSMSLAARAAMASRCGLSRSSTPRHGSASVVGELPVPTEAAVAVDLGGTVYVAGGDTTGGTSSSLRPMAAIYAFDALDGRLLRAGSLPVPVSNAGVAVLGHEGLGGGRGTGRRHAHGGRPGPRAQPEVRSRRAAAVRALLFTGSTCWSPTGATTASLSSTMPTRWSGPTPRGTRPLRREASTSPTTPSSSATVRPSSRTRRRTRQSSSSPIPRAACCGPTGTRASPGRRPGTSTTLMTPTS